MSDREAEVIVCLGREEVVAGKLWSHRRRDVESMTFSYDTSYIELPGSYPLDPSLPLFTGGHQTPAGGEIFGAFSDSAPDRWGRRVIGRAENKRARREGNAQASFGEIDYLLGVRDDLRQGALRFREPGSREFLAPDETGVPALMGLPKLLSAAENLEDGEDSEEDLRLLLRGGSSIGGARPKAHVIGQDGRLAIAKFPSPGADDWDVVRWEYVALQLARDSGVTIPDHELFVIDDKPVLIVNRFDRVANLRIGYVSAMTMLGLRDGNRASYLEIGETIGTESPNSTRDLRELWRRIAFSILISNFDDHLRNHGFLRDTSAGWSLSPAFDLNPDPRPVDRQLHTAIDLENPDANVDLLLSVAPAFRLTELAATKILSEISEATSRWRQVAEQAGLEDELELMEPAFEHEAALRARALASGRDSI